VTEDRLPPPTDDPGDDPSGPFRTALMNRILDYVRQERDPDFAFHHVRPIPWAPAPDPATVTVALVSSGALHLAGDPPFEVMTSRWGDTSFRVIPHGTPPDALDLAADYVDEKYLRKDPEVSLPLAALDRLVAAGRAGAAAARHYSLCEGIVRPLPGVTETTARLAELMAADDVGAVVLLPTCSLCVQTVALAAIELERRGLPTVVISLLPELTEHVGAPRALHVRFPFGAPCGDPGNGDLHDAVLTAALAWLAEAPAPGAAHHCRLRWRGNGKAPDAAD
jgi:D-proline reductase (dithiol) PrdB